MGERGAGLQSEASPACSTPLGSPAGSPASIPQPLLIQGQSWEFWGLDQNLRSSQRSRVGTWPQVPTNPLASGTNTPPGMCSWVQLQEVAEPGLGGRAGSVLSSWPLTLGVTVSEPLHPSPLHLSFSACLRGEWETPTRHIDAVAPREAPLGPPAICPWVALQPCGAAFLLCGLPGNAELPAKLAARTWLRTHL